MVLCTSSTFDMMFLWLSMTPFGSPVVPDVKSISRRLSGETFSIACPEAYPLHISSMLSIGIMRLRSFSPGSIDNMSFIYAFETITAFADENDSMKLWLTTDARASSGMATAPIHESAKSDIPHSGLFSPRSPTWSPRSMPSSFKRLANFFT